MKAVIVLFALLGIAFCIPTGKSGYSASYSASHYRPATYQASAPAYAPAYAPAPARAYYASGPVVTGTLHHSQDTHGQYNFGYSSSDGQSKSETRDGDGDVSGSYSYITPEGQKVNLAYTAGRGGFQASGDHLPEAPEVPDLPEDLAEAYREAHGRLAQAYAESSQRRGYAAHAGGAYRSDSYTAGYDDGSYRPSGDDGQYREHEVSRYVQGYDDGSYRPTHGSYRTYSTYRAPAPVFAPQTYRAAYQTYSAPAPAPAAYAPAAYAPAAPAPSRAPYGTVSYTTNIGGVPVAAPAPLSYAAAPVAAHKKSSYAYHG